jgi:hypothetical protein
MLNPYASQLGDLDPVEVIAATPIKLRSLIGAIGGERAEQPFDLPLPVIMIPSMRRHPKGMADFLV